MLNMWRWRALPWRRYRTSASQETWPVPITRCGRRRHGTVADSRCTGAASASAAHCTHPCPTSSPCSAQAPSFHRCPTAAVLVDASGSALITLPYCMTDVQEEVRVHLRRLLAQRLIAPLVTESLADLFGAQDSEGGSNTHADRSGDIVAMASAVVHSVTRSPSTLRYLVFSHENPRLRHPSWAPLWAPSPSLSIPSTVPCSSPAKPQATIHAGNKRPDEAVAEALDVRVTVVEKDAAEALVRPCLGEVVPLLGRQTCGSFLAVTATASGTLSATRSHSTKASTPTVTSAVPPPSPLPSLPVVAYWERCRVDSFIPSYVQVQAAVRHLLLRRRPTEGVTERAPSSAPAAFASVPQPPPARPLALVAVVAPDHLTELYSDFVDMLEREARQRSHEQHQQQRGATSGGPVQLLLFNSKGLAREHTAV
ncbi:hypothetical protein LSCM4_05823 [Leishmania orientalis]|uniref:Uncharacterized protein n=1 Tax=Leishmania orientalis TaxID=2249476 RepID=A0A836HN24_9TRYP|nr:hypothetical protein LSCM4_05823 [Leishmania orientalis]